MSHASSIIDGTSRQLRTNNRRLPDQRIGNVRTSFPEHKHDTQAMNQPDPTDLQIILRPFLLG